MYVSLCGGYANWLWASVLLPVYHSFLRARMFDFLFIYVSKRNQLEPLPPPPPPRPKKNITAHALADPRALDLPFPNFLNGTRW